MALCLFGNPLAESEEGNAAGMLEALNEIMLGDITVKVVNNQIVLASHSIASSLWLTLMEVEKSGKVVYCEVCNRPCIAMPKRRNVRRFCSDSCRQKNHRREKKATSKK